MPDLIGKRVVLDELHRAFDKISGASDALDNKLQNLLTFSSLIVSIAGAAEVTLRPTDMGIAFWVVLIFVLVLYIITFGVIVGSLSPVKYTLPISLEWEKVALQYFDEPEDDVLNRLIAVHGNVGKWTVESNSKKVRAIERASLLLMFIVVLLIAAVPFGLIFPHPTLMELVQAVSHSFGI